MYLPAHFAETRPEELHRIIREHPLGMLVNHGADGLDADHIPFMLVADEGAHGVLRAHVARANRVWQRCPTGTRVMVVFRGAEA
jgi:transcriptional regulator